MERARANLGSSTEPLLYPEGSDWGLDGLTKMTVTATRLFADDYSSTGQVEWRDGRRGGDPAYWSVDYLGQLRFDSLTSETLVIPDSHLLDGVFFKAVGPDDLLTALSRSASRGLRDDYAFPIEIRARCQTLAEALGDLLKHGDSPHLNHYVFKTIDDLALRTRVAMELGQTSVAQLERALASYANSADAVGQVLRAALHRLGEQDRADEVVGPMEDNWRAWLAAEKTLQVHQWPAAQHFRLPAALAVEPLDENQLHTPAGREALRITKLRVEQGSRYRGDISRHLSEIRGTANQTDDSSEVDEINVVERWYSRGRYRAIAWQHEAACVQVDRPWLEPTSALQALYREVREGSREKHVSVPHGVITALGDLSSEEFRAFTYEFRRELGAWWEGRSIHALSQVADGLAGKVKLDAERNAPVGVSEVLRVLGPAGAAAAGGLIGSIPGAIVGALVGSGGQVVANRLKKPRGAEVIRDRILEAWTYRREEGS
jgi:hypothetical protein